jgi:hypothetical protein
MNQDLNNASNAGHSLDDEQRINGSGSDHVAQKLINKYQRDLTRLKGSRDKSCKTFFSVNYIFNSSFFFLSFLFLQKIVFH